MCSGFQSHFLPDMLPDVIFMHASFSQNIGCSNNCGIPYPSFNDGMDHHLVAFPNGFDIDWRLISLSKGRALPNDSKGFPFEWATSKVMCLTPRQF